MPAKSRRTGSLRSRFVSGALALAALFLTITAESATYEACRVLPPEPTRELRGVWVATVANIDWPSQKNLSTQDQKAELLAILNRAVQLKLNAIIFQIRPACDALYASPIEPWSEYLTGTMGKAPEPFYDPLAFAIREAHQRGLELHAWLNPYRARLLTAKSPPAPTHVTRSRPHLVHRYADCLWLDPGEVEVQDYSLSVVMDVVKRYDVDGIHFDDYFYPSKYRDGSGNYVDFPDEASWRRFGAGGKLSREDWRRENVNVFIQRVYKNIKAIKPWVKFGISPAGIWRPKNPPQIVGLDAYGSLYADSRKWLASGWVDYFAPQLYWPIEPPDQSFPVLLRWWSDQNAKSRVLCPGLRSTKVNSSAEAPPHWRPQEILSQIRLTRLQRGASGHIHWSMNSLMQADALSQDLERVYQQPALVPPMPWLSRARPEQPGLRVISARAGATLEAAWTPGGADQPWLWLLQTRHGRRWSSEVLPAGKNTLLWKGDPPDIVALSAINRYGALSSPAVMQARRGSR